MKLNGNGRSLRIVFLLVLMLVSALDIPRVRTSTTPETADVAVIYIEEDGDPYDILKQKMWAKVYSLGRPFRVFNAKTLTESDLMDGSTPKFSLLYIDHLRAWLCSSGMVSEDFSDVIKYAVGNGSNAYFHGASACFCRTWLNLDYVGWVSAYDEQHNLTLLTNYAGNKTGDVATTTFGVGYYPFLHPQVDFSGTLIANLTHASDWSLGAFISNYGSGKIYFVNQFYYSIVTRYRDGDAVGVDPLFEKVAQKMLWDAAKYDFHFMPWNQHYSSMVVQLDSGIFSRLTNTSDTMTGIIEEMEAAAASDGGVLQWASMTITSGTGRLILTPGMPPAHIGPPSNKVYYSQIYVGEPENYTDPEDDGWYVILYNSTGSGAVDRCKVDLDKDLDFSDEIAVPINTTLTWNYAYKTRRWRWVGVWGTFQAPTILCTYRYVLSLDDQLFSSWMPYLTDKINSGFVVYCPRSYGYKEIYEIIESGGPYGVWRRCSDGEKMTVAQIQKRIQNMTDQCNDSSLPSWETFLWPPWGKYTTEMYQAIAAEGWVAGIYSSLIPVPYYVEGALSLGMDGVFNTNPTQYDTLVETSPWLRYVEYFVFHVDQDSGGAQHFFDILETTPYQNDTIWCTTGWKAAKRFERLNASLQAATFEITSPFTVEARINTPQILTLVLPTQFGIGGGYEAGGEKIYLRAKGNVSITYQTGETVKLVMDPVDTEIEMKVPLPRMAIIRVKKGSRTWYNWTRDMDGNVLIRDLGATETTIYIRDPNPILVDIYMIFVAFMAAYTAFIRKIKRRWGMMGLALIGVSLVILIVAGAWIFLYVLL